MVSIAIPEHEQAAPLYLRGVLTELLVLQGMDRQIGYRFVEDDCEDGDPPDPMLQAQALLRRRSPWRVTVTPWLKRAIKAALWLVLFELVFFALPFMREAPPLYKLGSALLLAVVLLLGELASAYSEKQIVAYDHTLQDDSVYQLWMLRLAEGSDSIERLRAHTPQPWRALFLGADPRKLGNAVRLLTLNFGWFQHGESGGLFSAGWLNTLLAISFVGLQFGFLMLQRSVPATLGASISATINIGLVIGITVMRASGEAAKRSMLIRYLIQRLYVQLRRDQA